MAWLLLVLAGLFEVGMALSLKASDGFTALRPSIAFGDSANGSRLGSIALIVVGVLGLRVAGTS